MAVRITSGHQEVQNQYPIIGDLYYLPYPGCRGEEGILVIGLCFQCPGAVDASQTLFYFILNEAFYRLSVRILRTF